MSIRRVVGAAAFELPLYAAQMLRPNRGSWVRVRNRAEKLTAPDASPGVRCEWQWTSDLHLCKVFPRTGLALMRRALREWPVVLADEPSSDSTAPEVSFIIGHRGLDRLPHLLMTIRSIAAQQEVAFECIVVEQSVEREVEQHLPAWVRYLHTPVTPEMHYNRSWAFNVGVHHARGNVLVFHDDDMLVPIHYGRELRDRAAEGFDVIDLKRFVFYLDEQHTKKTFDLQRLGLDSPPETVVQNLHGGTTAATRRGFEAIGGFDEAFSGWGGQDNDFWDRAQTVRVYPWAYLPIVHLWHAPHPGKIDRTLDPGFAHHEKIRALPVTARIDALRQKSSGRIGGPAI